MKIYRETNVYDASIERIDYIFKTFPKIYLSFSGGKDSGVMLNLCIDYMRKNNVTQKLGVMVMDNEANYTQSLEFMHRILKKNLDILDVYWICLPITLPCSVSSYDVTYITWGVDDENRWIRERPTESYVVHIDNYKEKGLDFYELDMHDKDFYDNFSLWYSQGELCANLIGIRTAESLNRFRAIINPRKEKIDGHIWTRKNLGNCYNCYPIYDWRTEDIWGANCLNDWDYNTLYDIFWKAGLGVHQMRVASPFMSESKSSLNLYRVIDPHVWIRLCGRVQGANFLATYGKALNYNNFKLPANHTWKSFVKFLLSTLPEETTLNFKQRFIQSIKYWWRVGRGLSTEIIDELIKHNIPFVYGKHTRHGRKDKICIRMLPQDHLDMLRCHNSEVTSWKRYAITILKNDHTCKYLGLAPTQEQLKRQKQIQEKYKTL